MTIDRLGATDPLQNAQKAARAHKAHGSKGSDSISLSSEAREMGEVFQALELAKAAPEVRADRVAEMKAKINDPAYLNDSVVSMTADKIIDQLYG